MKPAVLWLVERTFYKQENKPAAKIMVDNLRSTFAKLLRKNPWMDKETRELAEEKVREIWNDLMWD